MNLAWFVLHQYETLQEEGSWRFLVWGAGVYAVKAIYEFFIAPWTFYIVSTRQLTRKLSNGSFSIDF
jgi:hypothetical protein